MKRLLLLFILIPVLATAQTATLVDIQEASRKIKEKEQELITKEQELKAREERLDALEKDLVAREESLAAIRKEISDKLNTLDEESEAEINKLAKLYSSTKPKSAASVIVMMDIDRSAALMSRMQAMTAGRIMAEIAKIDPGYASRLSERMAGGDKSIKTLEVQ